MARILVIDDSTVMRNLLIEFLGDHGHTVEVQSNGQDGIDCALQTDFDICICDIHMPVKNGYQTYTEISTGRPDMQFIFTDSMPDETSEEILKMSAYSYLRKPFELSQLIELIGRLTDNVKK